AINVDNIPTVTSANATTFTVGSAGTFTVTTSGSPKPSIARGGAALPSGVTFVDNGNGTGTLAGTPAAGSGGTYAITFTATNRSGSSAAQNFSLTVNEAPVITTPATNQTVCAGATATFSARASGYPTPTLQWQSSTDGVTFTNIANATSSPYTTPATVSTDNGKQYRAVFSNTGGSNQTTATLTVNPVAPPTITASPAQVCANSTGNTASGPTSASYSWSINNGTITGGQNAQTVTYTAGA